MGRVLLCFFKVNSPFIVCMTYAFQTPEKLCFVLDLMNGRKTVLLLVHKRLAVLSFVRRR